MSAGAARPTWRARLQAFLLAQLRQGVTPPALAATIALGVTLGVFPVLGATTALCALAGVALRLNQPLIQAVNYAVYPLQLALLIPFCRAGETLWRAPPVPILALDALVARFQAGAGQFLLDYGAVVLYGVSVWCLVALPAAAALYALALPLLRALQKRPMR